MKCRVCNYPCKKIYITPKLPEYIWPGLKNNKFSECKLFGCQKCCSLQLQNFSKNRISSFYGKEAFNIISKKTHSLRIKIIKNYYGSDFLKKKKIIDIGGGANPILNNKSIDVYDFKKPNKSIKSFKCNIFTGDIEKINLKKKYDIIFFLNTLEHLPNPLRAINKIKDTLDYKGKIFIEVPNFDYLIKKMPHYAIFHQHLNMYDLNNLKNLFKLSNLTIEKIFINKDVIFCSVIKKNQSKKILKVNLNSKVDLNNKVKILKKNLLKQKKLLKTIFKQSSMNIYGAGGSAALFIANHKIDINKISNIYDSERRKINKFLPGTKIAIKKTYLDNKYPSISFYKINKRNNLYINEI